MHWYKVLVRETSADLRSWVGTSGLSPAELARAIEDGRMVRLDELLHMDQGVVREWQDRDSRLSSTIYINPSTVLSFMEFREDPRPESGE